MKIYGKFLTDMIAMMICFSSGYMDEMAIN